MYNSDAFWLSQWNLNVLWGLAWPEVQDDISASLIQYADNGGLLPRGPSGGGYSYIMTSCPATNLIVSTFMKGLLTKAAVFMPLRPLSETTFRGECSVARKRLSFIPDMDVPK